MPNTPYHIPKKPGPRLAQIKAWAESPDFHWTRRRRVSIVNSVSARVISEAEVRAMFDIQEDEWREWVRHSFCT